MNKTEQFYLSLFQNEITNHFDFDEVDWKEFLNMVSRHAVAPMIYNALNQRKITNPIMPNLREQTLWLYSRYYQVEQFTKKIVGLLEENEIPYILFKGITLAQYYPQCEWRKLGDVDIYVEEEDMREKAKKVFIKNGMTLEENVSDHQLKFYDTSFQHHLLELHFHLIGTYQSEKANQVVNDVFRKPIDYVLEEVHGKKYATLPPTKYVYYMLHHMARHYLHSGFGIRLLLDFTYYINANEIEIDFELVNEWCKKSGMLRFYKVVLNVGVKYLGLNLKVDEIAEDTLETFIDKVLHDKDVGEGSNKIVQRSRSYDKINIFAYLKEGHFQMKRRFKKLGKCFILWPLLWIITFVLFAKNTYFLRKTTFKETLERFKKGNEEVKGIRLFEDE